MGLRAAISRSAAAASLLLAGAAAAQSVDPKLLHAVEAQRPDTLELLKTIVDVDSGTGDVAGGAKVEALIEPRLRQVGAEVRHVPSETAGLPDAVVATLKGRGRVRVLIIAHIDTVFPPGTAASRPFRVEGDRALGPGVGDEKAGVAAAVAALKVLKATGFDGYGSLTLLLDNSEEQGSPGCVSLIRDLAKQSDVEFNMEPGDAPDAVTVWRKGSTSITISVSGRAAHAGMAPQDGRNAAVELIHQLDALDGRFPTSGPQTTVNLTLLKGGSRNNIIPEAAEGVLNVRYRQVSDLETVISAVEKDAASRKIPDTTVRITHTGAFPPLQETPETLGLAKRAVGIYAELGKTLELSGNGGASESALAQSVGAPALDGLGFVGGDFHTDHEWIDLRTVTPRTYLLTRLIMSVSKTPPPRAPSS